MNPGEVVHLTLEDLYYLVEQLMGDPRVVVRDHGLLASIAGRPAATIFGEDAYPDLATKAAALAHSANTSHPLVDGNKRLSLAAVRLFYGLNDVRLVASQDEKVDLITAIANGSLRDVEKIAEVLRAWEARGAGS